MAPRFDRFIAIDWSGAKSAYGHKIKVAVAERGDNPPELIRQGDKWTRADVLEWLRGEALGGPPSLIGFDFSFAPPFVDEAAFLPGEDTAETGPAFWQFVERETDDADYGAASFLEARRGQHFYLGAKDGVKADFMRLRTCERRFNAQGGGKPSSIFDAIGAAQVAKASFAGMRVLNQLRAHIPIWPFDAPGHNCVVEIYCRLFIRHARGRGLKVRNWGDLNEALAALGSQLISKNWDGLNDDESDALIGAAGLRALADEAKYWNPEGLSASVRATEGWTFGVS
ncbi:MAG: hypothetical protein PVF65_10470 [Sphingomonadales bacterium]